MKLLAKLMFVASLLSFTNQAFSCEWVNGYFKKNGQWVDGYWRGCH